MPFNRAWYDSIIPHKFLLKMKLLTFFMVVTLFQAWGTGYSQKVTLERKNITLETAFRSIESQTKYLFLYDKMEVPVNQQVSVRVKNESIEETLNQLFEGLPLSYKIFQHNIVIRKEERTGPRQSLVIPEAETVKPENESARTVSGKVTDEKGEGLPGVSILIRGTQSGMISDADGGFSIEVPDEKAVLVFSFVGYVSQEIEIGNRTKLDVVLDVDKKLLDEVVVIGYGTMERKHLTGSAGSIKMDETIGSRPVVDFGQAMYGKVAGVKVLNTSGRPGESSRVQIRGINSISAGSTPLVVIDGVPMPNFDLNTINAADIQSIDILKDAASAAIYGSRGANGVILVTTKTGVPQKSSVSFNYQLTFQQTLKKIDVMNSREYAQASIDAAQIGWIRSGGDPNAPNTMEARKQRKYTWPTALENPETLFDTDWQDVVLRTAPMHKADISLTGGDERSQYYLSLGAIKQDGIVIDTDYNRLNMNLSADTKVTNWLKFGGMLNAVYDKENVSNIHTLTAGSQYPSVYPIYGENGYLGGPLSVPGFEDWNAILFRANNGHPYYRLGEIDETKGLKAMANAYLEVSFSSKLKFKSSLRGFYKRSDNRFYQNGDVGMGPGAIRQVFYNSTMGRTVNMTSENLLSYSNKWNKHQVDAVVGYEYNKREFYSVYADRRNYENDLTPYLSAGSLIYGASDTAYESALISMLGRVNYNYDGRYLASVAFRRDGSSRFGPGNKWGNFPAVSAGWRLSEEAFMKEVRAVSSATLRASYGFTGNDNFADYTWISRMAQSRVAIGNSLITSYFPSSIENPDLRWERTRQLNMGLDIGFLDNRFQAEIDIYQSVSDDLLLNVPVPSTSGFTTVFTNIGELKNRGVELNLTTRNVSNSKWKWDTQLTLSHNKGKITRLGSNDAPMITTKEQMSVINKVGYAPFSFFGYEYDGVFMSQNEVDALQVKYPYEVHPGMGRYKDVNGDGQLNSEDRTVIGNAQPDFIWGLTNSFQFHNFDLSVLFHGSVGGKVFDSNWHRSMYYHEGRNYLKEANNRWRSEENPGNGHVHALSVDVAGTYEREASSYWIMSGTYTRLKDVTLGYTFPGTYLKRLGIDKVRIYLNATNLFTIQKTTTADPENQSGGPEDTAATGIQFSPYPTARTSTFGVHIKF